LPLKPQHGVASLPQAPSTDMFPPTPTPEQQALLATSQNDPLTQSALPAQLVRHVFMAQM
jgi:hypothetical protein